MGRIVRYPITLRQYLGRTWQAINTFTVPLDPLRLVMSRAQSDTKIEAVDIRGLGGTRSLARQPKWILPMSGRLFDPEWVPLTMDGYFPLPRPVWWPEERIVVVCSGTQPRGVAVIAGKAER